MRLCQAELPKGSVTGAVVHKHRRPAFSLRMQAYGVDMELGILHAHLTRIRYNVKILLFVHVLHFHLCCYYEASVFCVMVVSCWTLEFWEPNLQADCKVGLCEQSI